MINLPTKSINVVKKIKLHIFVYPEDSYSGQFDKVYESLRKVILFYKQFNLTNSPVYILRHADREEKPRKKLISRH